MFVFSILFYLVGFNMYLRLKIEVPPSKANFLNLIVNKYRKRKVKRFFYKIEKTLKFNAKNS